MSDHDHDPSDDQAQGARALQDERDITYLLLRYAEAVDFRDWERLRSCFDDGAELEYETSGVHDSPDAFVANCRRLTGMIRSTQHFVSNVVVRVDGDTASSRCYVWAQHTPIEGGPAFFLGGVYDDRHLRSASGWRIRSRRLSLRWTEGPRIDTRPEAV